MSRSRKYFQYINLFVALFLAYAFMNNGASCGLIFTPDSDQYLAAAQEINTSGRWPGDHDSNYLYWPPLYPMIVSLFEYPDTQLLPLNTVILVAIGLLFSQLASGIIHDGRIRMAFVSISLLNVHMVMTSVFLWSELIFTLLMMISLFFFFKMQENKRYLAVLIPFLCLLCFQRYAGLLIVFGLGAGLAIQKKYGPLKQRVLHGCLLTGVPASLILAWWHYISSGHPEVTFAKRLSVSVVADNLYLMLQTLANVFFPAPGIVGVLLLIVLVGLIGFHFRRQFSETTPVLQVVLVIFCYLSGILLLGDLHAGEIDRFLSVTMPLMMLAVFFVLDRMYVMCSKRFQIVLLVGVCLWMTYPLSRTLNNVMRWPEQSCNDPRHINRPLDE